jgi:hypothetical protein
MTPMDWSFRLVVIVMAAFGLAALDHYVLDHWLALLLRGAL